MKALSTETFGTQTFGAVLKAGAALTLALGVMAASTQSADAKGFLRGGAVVSDSAGSGAAVRGGCAGGSYGAGCRGAATKWGSDGSVSRRSGFAASGQNGSAYSAGGFNRGADGSISGGRDSAASGANGSYKGSTRFGNGWAERNATWSGANGRADVNSSWSKENGYNRSVSCYDTAGVAVACPH